MSTFLSIKRREFLKKSMGILAATYWLGSCSFRKNDYLFISASHSEKDKNASKEDKKKNPYLAVYDSTTDKTEVFSVPSLTHSIIQNPKNPYQFLCLPKLGDTAYLYDHNKKAIKPFETEKGLLFYGHGSFHPNGKSFYTAQSRGGKDINNDFKRSHYEGMIVLRDFNSMQKNNELDSYGFDPHDMVTFQDNKVIVANGGQDTNIVIVNLDNGKLIEKIPCEIEGIRCRHVATDGKGEYYVMTVINKLGRDHCHLLYPENGRLKPFKYNSRYNRFFETQLLSGVVGNDFIVTSSPDRNVIQIWDRNKKELIDIKELEKPAGISKTIEENSYIVTSEVETNGLEFGFEDHSVKKEIEKFNKMTGRHSLIARI